MVAPLYFVFRWLPVPPMITTTGGPAAERRATSDLPTINVRAHCRVSALMKDGSAEVRGRQTLAGERGGPVDFLLPLSEEIKSDEKSDATGQVEAKVR